MLKKVAILMDGDFVMKKMKAAVNHNVNSEEIYKFALKCIDKSEEIFRIFFYHCYPYEGKEKHPISQEEIDFSTTQVAKDNKKLLQELSQKDYMAVRKGNLVFRGWSINKFAMDRLQDHIVSRQTAVTSEISVSQTVSLSSLIRDDDFEPSFDQKEVDIKIGLDVAWLAIRRIVDKIILITGDTDLVPAMKFARKEGVQVVIIGIQTDRYLKSSIKEHADEIRTIKYNSNEWSIDK